MVVVATGIYSCQKENQAPQKSALKGNLAFKKDTVPPGVIKFTPSTLKKDTVPPGR